MPRNFNVLTAVSMVIVYNSSLIIFDVKKLSIFEIMIIRTEQAFSTTLYVRNLLHQSYFSSKIVRTNGPVAGIPKWSDESFEQLRFTKFGH